MEEADTLQPQFRNFLGAEEDSVHAQRRLFGFLRSIDIYLQWLTLGITRERQERPEVTNHKFRLLAPFQFAVQEGDATGAALFFFFLFFFPVCLASVC